MEKCPVCGNKQIINWVEELIKVEYSALTSKCITREKTGIANCWGYYCKCGWKSETFTE